MFLQYYAGIFILFVSTWYVRRWCVRNGDGQSSGCNSMCYRGAGRVYSEPSANAPVGNPSATPTSEQSTVEVRVPVDRFLLALLPAEASSVPPESSPPVCVETRFEFGFSKSGEVVALFRTREMELWPHIECARCESISSGAYFPRMVMRTPEGKPRAPAAFRDPMI